MRPRNRLFIVIPALVAGVIALWPTDASAQRRVVRRGHAPVIVTAYARHSYPYYYNYDDPFFSGWYGYQYRPYPPYARYGYQPGAELRIQVTPREAEVYIDGYLVGNVDDFDGVFQRLRVPYGEHAVSVYREGYRTITEKMLFRPYQSYHLKQAMEPIAAGGQPDPRPAPDPNASPDPPSGPDPRAGTDPRAPGRPPVRREAPAHDRDQSDQSDRFGSVAIRVQPRDAVVLVDGEPWNTATGEDRLLVELAEGEHRVEIRKDGFRPFTSRVTIRAGETATVNVSLPADR